MFPDFQEEREAMTRLIESRGVRHPRTLEALRATPRHYFVPDALRERAYEDRPLDIGLGQTISQPYMVALMTERLDPRPRDRVLEIGTGSGYQAAILSLLAGEVITIERHAALAAEARARMHALGINNVRIIVGDGTLGHPARAPYDAVLVTAAGPKLPAPLLAQLAEGGRLVCPVGGRLNQTLVFGMRAHGRFEPEYGEGCVFVPLIGEAGWPVEEGFSPSP